MHDALRPVDADGQSRRGFSERLERQRPVGLVAPRAESGRMVLLVELVVMAVRPVSSRAGSNRPADRRTSSGTSQWLASRTRTRWKCSSSHE